MSRVPGLQFVKPRACDSWRSWQETGCCMIVENKTQHATPHLHLANYTTSCGELLFVLGGMLEGRRVKRKHNGDFLFEEPVGLGNQKEDTILAVLSKANNSVETLRLTARSPSKAKLCNSPSHPRRCQSVHPAGGV